MCDLVASGASWFLALGPFLVQTKQCVLARVDSVLTSIAQREGHEQRGRYEWRYVKRKSNFRKKHYVLNAGQHI